MQAARTPAAPSAPQGWLGSLLLWRSAALAGVVGTVAAVVLGLQAQDALRHTTGTQIATLQQQLQAAPQIQYVAVLQDAQSSASMLVTFDPKSNQLVLQRVGGFSEGAEKSLQLWAVQPGGGGVRSLGVMGHQAVYTLPAAQADMQGVPALAISLEPLGGVPGEGGPTGPVLFKGELIERTV
jgi:anti-sigma-K factor RskA